MSHNKYRIVSQKYHLITDGFWKPFSLLFRKKIFKGDHFSLIDFGCGAADALAYLGDNICDYKGIDHSENMISIARCRYPTRHFEIGDIVNYSPKIGERYDVVLSVFDTINHLLRKEDWIRFFNSAYSLLENNGLLVFDICTKADHANNWNNYHEIKEDFDFLWARKGEYDPASGIGKIHNYFFILDNDSGLYNREYDLMEQISFEIDEVIDMLRSEKFHNIDVFDLHTGKKADSNTTVAVFFCKK